MSIKMMNLVWGCGAYEADRMLVLLAMADHADDQGGKIFPTVRHLARKARISPRQVHRCIKDLKTDGMLSHDKRFPKTATGAVAYCLNVAKLKQLNDAEDARIAVEQAAEGSAQQAEGGGDFGRGGMTNVAEGGLPLLADNNRHSKPSDNHHVPPVGGKPAASKKSSTPKTAIGDWTPGQHDLDNAVAYWAERGRGDIAVQDQAVAFLAHHRANGTRMADWPQAWVTWYAKAPQMVRAPFAGRGETVNVAERDLVMWLSRLTRYHHGFPGDDIEDPVQKGYWLAEWGPPPGATGCKVPQPARAQYAKQFPLRAVR